MGRPWNFFWIIPYPNFRGPLWVNFRSPLLWDFMAISTYFTISLVFWYIGLVPDLATLRDRTTSKIKAFFYRLFSLGWNGSYRNWSRYETSYLLLAALATPLVLSVHSIVSMDFATSVIPGWHSTIFPPYFVAGAVFSGFAMVLTLMIIARKVLSYEEYITVDHIEKMGKIVLLTGGIVALSYLIEAFMAWYSGNPYERFVFANRAFGPYAWAFWLMIFCNVVVSQLFWIKKFRRNITLVFIASLFINVGMWFERFVIIVTSLHRDFLPSSWVMYKPTIIEIATLAGSFGLFFTLFLLFVRFVPFIAMGEVKGVLHYGKKYLGGTGMTTPYYLGIFDNEDSLLSATRKAREAGYAIHDVYTPYAVHGLNEAMGLKHNLLTWVCLGFALAGLLFALWFQFWIGSINWPLNVGGRPFNSLPAYLPVMFELTVLVGGLGVVAVMLVRNRLYPGKQETLVYRAVTNDRFVIALREEDASFDPREVDQLWAHDGVVETREVKEEIL